MSNSLPAQAIHVHNVNSALYKALDRVASYGYKEESRNGTAYVLPGLLVTSYLHPQQRVLFSPARDCNPFFHFFESLWMLAGRQDVDIPAHFASNMKNFSVDGLTFNAAYGFRWRRWLSGDEGSTIDQIRGVVWKLVDSPNTRQAVINIWDPSLDLEDSPSNAKDRACNLNVVFTPRPPKNGKGPFSLDMTVSNRSNDLVWGAYGANAVHFSMLHEFVAHAASMRVGVYNQVSANAHVYSAKLYGEKLWNALTEEHSNENGWTPKDNEQDEYALSQELRVHSIGDWCWSTRAALFMYNVEDFCSDQHRGTRGDIAAGVLERLRGVEHFCDHLLKAVSQAASLPPSKWERPEEIISTIGSFVKYTELQAAMIRFLAVPLLTAHTAYKLGYHQEALAILEYADTRLENKYEASPEFIRPHDAESPVNSADDVEALSESSSRFLHIRNDWLRAASQWVARRIPAL